MYWRKEGRLSVDAVIIVVCVAALFVLGLNPFGDLGDPGLSGDVFRLALAFWFVLIIVPVVLCLLKGKIWTGVIGLFVPLVAIVGAIRLARLNSPWARRRYKNKPKKLARAQRREARLDARWIAWRDAFFDLIAGKPHLPSLPPRALPAAAAEAATADSGRRATDDPAPARRAAAQAPADATTARSSRNRRCAGTMASRAASSVNHAARSTSGNSACLPDRGGHSIVNVLLVMAAASQSCSTAQAKMSLWP